MEAVKIAAAVCVAALLRASCVAVPFTPGVRGIQAATNIMHTQKSNIFLVMMSSF
jgi:hypothetical protein